MDKIALPVILSALAAFSVLFPPEIYTQSSFLCLTAIFSLSLLIALKGTSFPRHIFLLTLFFYSTRI